MARPREGFDSEICWLIDDPRDPPAFQELLDLLRDDVPGACVAEHEPGRFTVFSAIGEMPSLQKWERAGLPIVEIGPNANDLAMWALNRDDAPE